ncbi:tail fiber protein [Bradyrhizobium sp. 195]|uniref:tail fiber protein n=1 Tax=Bradyrhizobium sp. 195 TaxID=2782662 RepID=UPI0020017E74|nr:tail fiber protein [Bradyrhizobium sp. 195]UPK23876.1 phage tail protein [Bradyrhizobium sp. 195]
MSGVAWWSQTAAANSNADPSVGWAEGMAPSSVNDSARAEMASVKKWADDIAGATVTGGSSTAYTLSTFQSFDTLARLNGQVIAFTPHTTSTAGSPNITLNVDSLGAKTIQLNPGVDVPAGYLVAGSPYVVIYNAANGVFYLQNSFANPYLIPIGATIDFIGSTSPNSSFVLPYGQAISRSTYSTLFSLISTTYGSGDGSSTFNIPDLRGRVVAGKDDMGGSAASRLSGSFITGPTTLGGTGGSESRQLATSNLPPYTPAGSIGGSISSNPYSIQIGNGTSHGSLATGADSSYPKTNEAALSFSMSGATFTGTAQGGTSAAFGILQPTMVLNKLLRII